MVDDPLDDLAWYFFDELLDLVELQYFKLVQFLLLLKDLDPGSWP